jgi:uncharacterized protein (TIGR03503 family)
MQKCSRILITVFFFGLYSNLYAAAKTDDIRILIDVSDSMKINDPSDFRESALKMFNGLVAEGSKAGIWTIDRYVHMTVNWGTVNDVWRQVADAGASTIHSDGVYTNIESGLSRASLGWEEADADTRRSIILITDGSVNISQDVITNQVSRQNIISKNLQTLKKSGVVIHTIALSDHSDESLLKKLALDTGGSFQKAEFALDLQRVLFRTFEKATQPDTIKLTENQFSIDKNVRRMTLLVFRQKHSAPTLLYRPQGDPMSANNPGTSIWRSNPGYDLITIKNPLTGVWNIDAAADSDSRLMVETDLRLNVTGINSYMTPGQPLQINVELHNLENKVIETSLLEYVDFSIAHTGIDGTEKISRLDPDGETAGDGQYLFNIENGLEEGVHGFVISADSQIFNRSRRFNIEVQWPVVVRVDPGSDPGKYQLSIRPREASIDQSGLRPSVILQAPDGNRQDLALIQVDNDWRTEIETDQDGVYQAFIKINSSSADNEPLSYDLGGFPMTGMFRQPISQETEIESTITTDPAPSTVVVVVADSVSEKVLKVETAVAPQIAKVDKQPDWTRISIEMTVINLIFLIIAAGVWLFLRDQKDEAGLRLVQVVENV